MKPFGIFLSTEVTRAFLWFLNLQRRAGEKRRKQRGDKGQIFDLQNRGVKHIKKANSKYQNQYQPSQRGKAAPPHAVVRPVSEWLTVAWPDLAVFVCCLSRCSCLPISLCSPPVSKPPPLWCPDLTRSISCSLTGFEGGGGLKRGGGGGGGKDSPPKQKKFFSARRRSVYLRQ